MILTTQVHQIDMARLHVWRRRIRMKTKSDLVGAVGLIRDTMMTKCTKPRVTITNDKRRAGKARSRNISLGNTIERTEYPLSRCRVVTGKVEQENMGNGTWVVIRDITLNDPWASGTTIGTVSAWATSILYTVQASERRRGVTVE
jgi:hypothetical protein